MVQLTEKPVRTAALPSGRLKCGLESADAADVSVVEQARSAGVRDHPSRGAEPHPSWWKSAARYMVLALAGAALLPAIMPFSPDIESVCVPIVEGWHADRRKPSEADVREVFDVMVNLPSTALMTDPTRRQAWLAEERARTSTPGYKRAEAYIEWLDGPGACIPESRHRLILSAAGLGGIAAVAGTTRLRRRSG